MNQTPTFEDFKLSQEEYEVIYPQSVAASKVLADMYVRLGKPEDPFSKAGEQMMRFIIAVWEDLYPQEVKYHKMRIKQYREDEKTVQEQVKEKTGRSLASVPTHIYRMMKKIFPNFKMNSRDDFIKLTNKYPMFKVTGEKSDGGGHIFMGKK